MHLNEQLPEKNKQKINLAKGIYLLPNLFTTGALFGGFYSIVASMQGNFELATIAILISMLLDGLDGRIARMTNTQSDFGAEYDSLSDIVCFGVAPSLVIYIFALQHLGKLGWIVAFLYTVATALRLARFNSKVSSKDINYFEGLPCPSAAALMVSLVWVANDWSMTGNEAKWLCLSFALLVSVLMVSSVPYSSFKEIDLKGKMPFISLLVCIILLACIALDPPSIFLLFFLSYIISGPLFMLMCFLGLKK